MKTILFLCSSLAYAGSLGIVCPLTTIRPPISLVCAITSTGPHTLPPVGYQWNITTSQPVGVITVVASGTAGPAGKTASSNSQGLMLLTGMNSTPIPDGTIATITIPVPASVTCAGNSPCFIITLLGQLGTSSKPAKGVPENANPPVSVYVSNACDLNADGLVNGLDVTVEQSKVLAIPQQAGDLNADGQTNAIDVQIVIDAAGGAACTAI